MPDVHISDETAALLRELWQGMTDEHGETRTEAELVEDAVKRVHRGFFGLAPDDPNGPQEPTGPFRKWASGRRAEVLLRQIDATRFRLSQPFRYDDGTKRFDVPEDDVTDLASVPPFLTWLVPRYGRHTLAALTHDHLQRAPDVTSTEADGIFRDAMGQTGVPLARRWLMWSAVALRTELKRGGWRSVRVVAWVGGFGVAGLVLWPGAVYVIVTAPAKRALAAAVLAGGVAAPIALSPVWGQLWPVGAMTGTALLLLAPQMALVLAAISGYAGVEWLVEHVLVPRPERHPVFVKPVFVKPD